VSDVNPVAAAGFGAAAEIYERARPSYPAEAVEWIAERTGLDHGRTVVDVGAGTGKLTRLLVGTHARVIAVEPLEQMRAVLLVQVPGVEVLAGTAEALPLPDASVDVVTAAQAFHWFAHEAALRELYRVLKPGGFLVLVWNSRDLADPLQRALEDVLAPERKEVVAQIEGTWRAPLAASRLFGPLEERSFRYEQHLTVAGLRERVSSTSFVAAMQPHEREALLARVEALTAGLEEPFPFRYLTEIYLSRKGSSAAPDASASTT
jgi:ubiquinone/menaquinone biosynthesis C-methylase UbiE